MVSSTLISSAGRTAFTAAGYAIAGPLGGIVGGLIGGVVFGFGGGPDVEGPRLNSLDVSSSAYGNAIPRGYALAKIQGTTIWATDIVEEKNVEKAGGGLFGGGQKVTTYRYFANFAVAFGEGPATAITRLWAGDKLLWDKSEDTSDIENGQSVGGVVKHLLSLRDMRVRVYLGTEDQEPDPFIAQEVEAETGEANAIPAHRGLVYVVLERMPLEDFGNRVPPITAEVNWLGTEERPQRDIETLSGTSIDSNDSIAVDWNRWRGYFPSGAGISRVRLDTLTEEFFSADTDDSNGNTPRPENVTRSGLVIGTASQTRSLIDPDSLQVLAEIDHSGITNPTHLQSAAFVVTGSSGSREMVADIHVTGGMLVYTIEDEGPAGFSLERLWSANSGSLAGGDASRCVGGNERRGSSDVWFVSEGSGGTVGLIRLDIKAVAVLDPFDEGDTVPIGVERTDLSIDASDVDAGATSITTVTVVHVPDLSSIAVLVTLDTGIFWVVVDRDGNVTRAVEVGGSFAAGSSAFFHQSRIIGTKVAFSNDQRVIAVDLATGETLRDENVWTNAESSQGINVYDSMSDTIYTGGVGRDIHRLFLNRSSNTVLLSTVVSDLCTTAGLSASELDVTELTDVVRGFVLAQQTPYRKALELLAAAYLFDVVESDFQLKFLKRGRSVTRSFTEEDLLEIEEDGQTLVENRSQDVELPLRFSVTYRDVQRDSDLGVQSVQRVSNPDPTMRSRNEMSLDLPLTLTPKEAKEVVQSLMYSAWVERTSQEFGTDFTNVDLDPTDVIQLTLDSGKVLRLRIEKVDVGANFKLRFQTVVEESTSYTADALTDGGRLFRRFELPGSSESKLAIMDMPLVEDDHDIERAAIQLYWAAGQAGIGTWPGGALYFTDDGFGLVFVDEQFEGMNWGVLVGVLGDTELPWQIDETNEVEVFMREGSLSTITELAMLQGGNRAAVVDLDGSVEIIHFRDAVEDPDVPGRYTLSFLLRGRRGTENFTGGHAVGSILVMLDDEDTFDRQSLPLTDLDETKSWKFVGRGAAPSEVRSVQHTVEARDLKPYAPTGHGASGGPIGTADVTLSWVRRTRVLGDLQNLTGTIPLEEDSEEYELEILGPDGVVVRTVTALTSPSYLYTVAEQDADFAPYLFALTNGSFETGDLTGWTVESGNVQVHESFGGISAAQDGSFFLRSGDSFVLAQTADVSSWSRTIDAGDVTATAKMWLAGASGSDDEGRVTMQFLDANDVELGTEVPAYTDPASTTWVQVQASATLPIGTRKVKVRVDGNEVSGPGSDAAFDNVTLELEGDPLREIEFTVYQISAQVGRGFAGTDRVEVVT